MIRSAAHRPVLPCWRLLLVTAGKSSSRPVRERPDGLVRRIIAEITVLYRGIIIGGRRHIAKTQPQMLDRQLPDREEQRIGRTDQIAACANQNAPPAPRYLPGLQHVPRRARAA